MAYQQIKDIQSNQSEVSEKSLTINSNYNKEYEQKIPKTLSPTVIVDRIRAMTIKLKFKMNNINCSAVIATGVEVTVINDQLFKMIPENLRPPIKNAKRKLVVAEANKDMTVCGVTQVSFDIGKKKKNWPVYLAPIRD